MLTETPFCRNLSFRSIIDIAIDLFTSEDWYLTWIPTAPLCLQARSYLGSRMRVLHSRGTGHPICDLGVRSLLLNSSMLLLLFHEPLNVSNNCIYFYTHLLAGTNSIAIDLMTMKDYFFFQHRHRHPPPPPPHHHHPPPPPPTPHPPHPHPHTHTPHTHTREIRHFFLLAVVIADDSAMTLAFLVVQKISRIKLSLQFISTFGRNIALSLRYLGPVTVFQKI